MKNKYEINYYEVESCMIKLFGEYDIFDHKNIKHRIEYRTTPPFNSLTDKMFEGLRAIWLTTGGKCVADKGLNHTQMTIITIRCYLDGKSEKEKGFIKKQFPWIPYNNFLEWDDMYGKNIPDNIKDYLKLKPSVETDNDFPLGVPEGGIYSSHEINHKILKESGIVRISKRRDQYGDELNIEAHHPLTHSQRRFLLDVIEFYKVDNVYIDDFSNQSGVVANQLGIRKEYVKNI